MPQMNGYIGRGPGDSAVTKARQVFNVTGSTSTFTFASGYDVGYFEVYINGVKLVVNNDYTAGDGTTFTLTSAASNGDVIEAIAYKAFNLANINEFDTASGDFNVTDDLTVGGDVTVSGTITGDGSGLTNVSVGAGSSIVQGNTTAKVVDTGSDGIFVVETEGTERLRITSDGSVGIGTTNPNSEVLIGNDKRLAVGVLTARNIFGTNVDSLGIITAREQINVGDYIQHLSDTDTRFGFPADDTFIVDTAGEERLRINSSGNVSIGTDAPLFNDKESLLYLLNDQGGQSGRIAFDIDVSSGYGVTFRQDDSGLNLFVNSNFRDFIINTGISGDERLRVTNSGNIGIGTSIPHTNSALQISRDTFFDLTLERTGGSAGICTIGNRGNQLRLSNNVDGIRFDTGNGDTNIEERVRITDTGDVGIGTDDPTEKLHVLGDARVTGILTVGTASVTIDGTNSRIGIESSSPRVAVDVSQATDGIALPVGTQAQRPTGVEGYMRFNSESKALEIYNGTNWVEIISDYFPQGSVVLG